MVYDCAGKSDNKGYWTPKKKKKKKKTEVATIVFILKKLKFFFLRLELNFAQNVSELTK